MKLFGFLSRAHKPDIDALSALVDGALGADGVAVLEAHIAGCDACAAELDGLRRVKSMLAAMPQIEPGRSFRVRLADVEAPASRRATLAGGTASRSLLRAMPALGAAAAFVFVGALATDFSTRDGGSERQALSGPVADSAARSEADDGTLQDTNDNDFAAGDGTGETRNAGEPTAELPAAATAPDVVEPEPPSDGAAGGGADESEDPAAGRAEYDPTTTRMETLEAANAESSDDDDSNRTGFLIVEIAAGALALAAGAAFVVSRRSRNEGQA